MRNSDIFPQSEELARLVESNGWSLYQMPLDGSTLPWDKINLLKPSRTFEIPNNYFLIPHATSGQTLRDAYAVTMGLGPCVRLDNLEQHIDMDGEGGVFVNKKLTYFFTRLIFNEFRGRRVVVATSGKSKANPNPPVLMMLWESAMEKLRQHFKIISPGEYKRWADSIQPARDFHNLN